MILHVLPGDATVESFKQTGIEGEIAVCREALVDGDVSGNTLPEFWETRASVLIGDEVKSRAEYHDRVVREFAKLTAIQSDSEMNLWFEYELFCSVNFWFCLSLIGDTSADVYRVAPATLSKDDVWDGFAKMSAEDLRECFARRTVMSGDDIRLGSALWSAYKANDNLELERLSHEVSPSFPMLREVCEAAIARESRPKAIVEEIIGCGEKEFAGVFEKFRSRAGVYGYGDTQVRKIWQDLLV
jgi:hypothetical protein